MRRRCALRRDRRHGIVLVFVVVLLVLLAIMGTAYLAVSRADRQNVIGRGASSEGAKRALLRDTSLFERLQALAEDRVKDAIIDDLFGGSPTRTLQNFRTGSGAITAYGPTQPWLSSLLPSLPDPTQPSDSNANRPFWRWMSAPLTQAGGVFAEAQFADPRAPNTTSASLRPGQRTGGFISQVAMQRATASSTSGPRLYPGIQFNSAAGSDVFIAADADGDGIADSLLVPMVLNASLPATNIRRYLDESNNCIYYYAVRVVDNSAKVNVQTALSVRAAQDLRVAEGGATPSVAGSTVGADNGFWARIRARANTTSPTDRPNLGLFKSDVGFVEMLDGLQSFYEQINPNIGAAVRQAEIERILETRLPGIVRPNDSTKFDAFAGTVTLPNVSGVPNNNGQTSTFMRTGVGFGMQLRAAAMPLTAAEWSSLPTDVANGTSVSSFETLRYQSVGDYLENGVLRQSRSPLPWGFTTGSAALNDVQVLRTQPVTSGTNVALFRGGLLGTPDDAAALAYRGGSLRNKLVSQANIERTLADSAFYSSPNFGINQSNAWSYFPANEWKLWYDWTQDFRAVLGNVTTPGLTPADAPYALATPYAGRSGGQANVSLTRSLRPLLTTESAVSDATPTRPLAPEHAAYGLPVTVDQHPATRIPAATASFKALYRGFYGAMTLPTGAARTANTSFNDDQIFRWGRTAGQAGTFTLGDGTPEMARLRAAIAAANTVAMRRIGDGRNPESVAETDNTFDRDIPAFRVQLNAQYFARVFGVRPQPYISEVIASPGNGNADSDVLYIELFNPYPFAINLAQYSIAAIERSTPTTQSGTSVVRLVAGTEVPLTGVIPAGGYRVIGFGTPGTAVNLTTAGTIIDASSALKGKIQNEIALFRARRGDGVLFQQVPAGSSTRGQLVDAQLNETETAGDPLTRVPLDVIDLRALPAAGTPVPTAAVPTPPDRPYVEYRRTTSGPNVDADKWRCVYAGPMQRSMDPIKARRRDGSFAYDPTDAESRLSILPPPSNITQDVLAIRETTFSTNVTVTASGRGSLGAANNAPLGIPDSVTMEPNVATFLAPVINLYFPNTAALAATVGIRNGAAPFGTPFGRDGDVMNVPFIGSYIIERTNGDVVEFVPMSVDAVVADNNDGSDTASGATIANRAVGRFDPQQSATSWSTQLNEFVSARGSNARVLIPEIAPVIEGTAGATASRTADAPIQGNEGTANPALVRWVAFGTSTTASTAQVTPVDQSTAAIDAERLLRQVGRINVNTAPPAVLGMLPFVVDPATGQVNLTANQAFATQLASRQATPAQALTNLHELRTVPTYPTITATTREQLLRSGDLTPPPGAAAVDLGDYKRETLNVARVSNLATVRSDSFTVYITVQAWSASTDSGWDQVRDTRLIAEKRTAFIVDRTPLGPNADGTDVVKSSDKLRIIPIERD